MKFTILEPMSTGDVIDRAVRLYRRNFTPLIAIAAVPTLIGYAVGMMFYYGYANAVLNAAQPGGASGDVHIEVHNPADRGKLSFLTNTKSGKPIYLNRAVADADFVIPIGAARSRTSVP